MRKPTRYILGVYDPDPDETNVEFAYATFANTAAGIRAMREVIRDHYDRGGEYCVGIYPASGRSKRPIEWARRRARS